MEASRTNAFNRRLGECRLRAASPRMGVPSRPLYLLFLDESGTHGGSPVFILAGLAVHETDAYHLQQKVGLYLQGRLAQPPLSLNSQNFELHATDIKNGKREWAAVPDLGTRLSILHSAYTAIVTFKASDTRFPVALFGAVVDRTKIPDRKDRERFAYELSGKTVVGVGL